MFPQTGHPLSQHILIAPPARDENCFSPVLLAFATIAEPLEFLGTVIGDLLRVLLVDDALPQAEEQRAFQIPLAEGEHGTALSVPLLTQFLFCRSHRGG